MHFASRFPRHLILRTALIVLAVIFLYYPLGMLWVHRIDDDAAFAQNYLNETQGSAAVQSASALLTREISGHWTPNDPFFYPGAALVRMPAFQRGISAAIARFALSLNDQIGRTRGSGLADADLQKAVGFLNYPPDVWLVNPEVSRFLPTASAEANYRSGVEALERYNARVAKGEAVFERRADNLLDALERIAADMGSASAATDNFLHERSVFSVNAAGTLYYENKGKLYAYFILLRALEKDFAPVIAEKQLTAVWGQALASLADGMALKPWLVINGAADSMVMPSHLASQGFYLMRVRTQLREITNILLK